MMKKSLLLLLCLFAALATISAQTSPVRGVVLSAENNEPLAGATIVAKGATIGTITGHDGTFMLNVPENIKTLIVTFLGMIPQEVSVAPNVRVLLKSSDISLEEVVVVGYGVQRKKDVTSSISQIKGNDLAGKATPSFTQQMAGRSSGVQVISPSGDVTQPPKVIIRGMGTISSSTEPLYVINGIPITSGNLSYSYSNNNALSDINPADIESLEILKDGAATAIYGSRAANGVVLITTKKGKLGAAKMTYDTWMGVSKAAKLYDLLNAQQFVEISNEKFTNNGDPGPAKMDEKGTDTNWYDYTFRTGFQQSHTIGLSGASPETQYYLSAGYTDQKGLVINNSYRRYTFYGKAEQKILKNYASVGFSLNASMQHNQGPSKGTNSLSDNMYATTRMLPNVAVYNPDDPTGYNIAADRKSLGMGSNLRPIDNSVPNIVWVLKHNEQRNISYRLLPTANLDIKPVNWLTYRAMVGADVVLVDDKYLWHPDSGDGYGYKGLIDRNSIKRQRWNFQNILTFVKSFGEHNVDATAVAEWTNYTYSRFGGAGREFSDSFFVDELIGNTYVTQSSGGSWTTNGLASYIFRANYNYNSLYYIGGSIRRDGISVLAKENRWGTFYGLSAALRVSNYDFWKNNSVSDYINDLRIRGSYAEVGNDRLSGNFLYKDIFIGQKYGEQVGVAYYQAGNPDLKWETQKIFDVGFDMAFLNGRFNLVFAYWSKVNDGIVLDVPTPPSMGIPWNYITQNYGTIKNNGIELELGGNIIQDKAVNWKSSFNFSTQTSKITKLGDDIAYEHYILREGESMNALYGYRYAGVNMANGNPMYYKADNTIVQGDYKTGKYYEYNAANPGDMSTVSNLTTDDKAILGNSIPKWFGGWDNTVTWRNFDLNLFFRFSGGNKVANVTRRDLLDMRFFNNGTEILNRWQSVDKPGNGKVPKISYGNSDFINLGQSGSSRWIENGDFLKLQNIAIGYTVPKKVCNTLMIERLRIYAQVQNVFTLTKYSGLDPESYTEVAGVDWNGNPQQRIFLVGLSIGF